MSQLFKQNTIPSPTRNSHVNRSASTVHTLPLSMRTLSFHNNNHQQHRLLSSFSSVISKSKLITPDRLMLLKKKQLKRKFLSTIHNRLILNRTMYERSDDKFHFENEMQHRQTKAKELLRISHEKKKFTVNRRSFVFSKQNELFSKYKTTFRYEDMHESPYEVLMNNFTQGEIALMQRSPQYFLLTKPPFNECGLKFNVSLKDVLNEEDYGVNVNEKEEGKRSCEKDNKGKKVVQNFYKENMRYNMDNNERRCKSMRCKSVSNVKRRMTCKGNNSNKIGNVNINVYSKRNEESEINKNYLYSSFYYEKLFNEIEERKQLTQLKRQGMLNHKKERFELLKNRHVCKSTVNDEDMYKARKVVNVIEKNFLKKIH